MLCNIRFANEQDRWGGGVGWRTITFHTNICRRTSILHGFNCSLIVRLGRRSRASFCRKCLRSVAKCGAVHQWDACLLRRTQTFPLTGSVRVQVYECVCHTVDLKCTTRSIHPLARKSHRESINAGSGTQTHKHTLHSPLNLTFMFSCAHGDGFAFNYPERVLNGN